MELLKVRFLRRLSWLEASVKSEGHKWSYVMRFGALRHQLPVAPVFRCDQKPAAECRTPAPPVLRAEHGSVFRRVTVSWPWPAVRMDSMTLPAVNSETPAHQNNVRLVVVDDKQQPSYLKRATELEKALLAAAAKVNVYVQDMPGLYGLCVEAVRSAEIREQ
jgi:hypothetical protein